MSQMQWGLATLGAVVLLCMVIYNSWQARKLRPRQPAQVGDAGSDPQEPTLDVGAFDAPAFAIPAPKKESGLDALIDSLVPIALESAVSGDAVLAALPPTRRVGSKPFGVEGFNSATERWEFAQPGQRYSQLQAGLQLANRSGAINDIEFSEFVMKTQAFCDAINGTPDFPEMRQEVNRARELDQFAGDHDAQLGFMLLARRTAWSPSYIQQMASRHGFVPGAIAGRMVLPAANVGLPPVLSLSFDSQAALADDPAQSALRELHLALDVPQVDRSEQAFERMRQAAVALAADMDAVVTDDHGVPVPAEAMDQIAKDLQTLYDTLDQHELSAGSVLARRLFS